MNNALRILLADDHTVMRSGLRVLLERHPGFCVVAEASDGTEAVELADTKCPDVGIIDIAMPRLNGIEATRQITAKGRGRDGHYWPPPAQIRTGGITAYGSCLRS
jgi:DNA-binding NarL/FixJ family response regulator